jgi:hypothetical protein
MNRIPINHAAIRHPGISSGVDLINSGIADTFGLGNGTYDGYTRHKQLFGLKDRVAVALWKPGYWNDEGYWQAGWYCLRTHKMILMDAFWGPEDDTFPEQKETK